jgi:hypothetical protein
MPGLVRQKRMEGADRAWGQRTAIGLALENAVGSRKRPCELSSELLAFLGSPEWARGGIVARSRSQQQGTSAREWGAASRPGVRGEGRDGLDELPEER